jgi:hypothetical protein
MLESALENIGFVRGTALRSQPWLTRYGTVVTDGDFLQIGSPGSLLCILKPHGCVHALMNAEIKFNQGDVAAAETLSSRFLITASELQKIRTDITDQKFFNQMVSELQAKPLLVAGWSISEPYLRAVIEKRLAALLGQGKVEDLSIVDILFNDQGHKEIVDCYKLSKGDVFFEVAHLNNVFDIDEFFLWLQTKFCIDQLEIAAPNLVEPLKAIGDLSVSSALDQFLVSWADKFLPAWTLFCWRSKIIDCAGFQPQELDLDRRNEYVPWRIPKNLPRPDLVAAARFLIAIAPQRSIWNLEKFPGALFRSSDARLVIPVPAWRTLDELSGIRPLIKGWASELSFVEKVDLVPMSPTSDPINIEAFSKQFSKAVASFMPVPRFSNPANIGVATDLLGQG